jgi:hypothetical protein
MLSGCCTFVYLYVDMNNANGCADSRFSVVVGYGAAPNAESERLTAGSGWGGGGIQITRICAPSTARQAIHASMQNYGHSYSAGRSGSVGGDGHRDTGCSWYRKMGRCPAGW